MVQLGGMNARLLLLLTGCIGSFACMITSIDLIVSSFSVFLHPPSHHFEFSFKAGVLALLYIAMAFALGTASALLWNENTIQGRIVREWSWLSVLSWLAGASLIAAMYYPVPYVNHHADALYILLFILGIWLYGFIFRPRWLSRGLDSTAFLYARVSLMNLVAVILLSEFVLHAAGPLLSRHGTFDAQSHVPFGLAPHRPTVGSIQRLNAQGFRDAERSVLPRTSAPRLLALGDSFTVGVGVSYDEGFMARTEKGLQQIAPGAELINLGVGGFQPDEYLSVLKVIGLGYKPDLVLLNFYMGNDFEPSPRDYILFAGLRWKVHVNGNWMHDHFAPDHWNLAHALTYIYRVGRSRISYWLGLQPAGFWDSTDGTPMGTLPSEAFQG